MSTYLQHPDNAQGIATTNGLGFAFLAPLIVGAIGAGSQGGMLFWQTNKINAQQKVSTTNTANDIEERMRNNRDSYLGYTQRTTDDKATALAIFDQLWGALRAGCEGKGAAGNRCISDRMRGGTWDWASYYRDPIEADVPPAPSPASMIQTLTAGATGGAGGGAISPLMIALGAGLVALVLLKD